MCIRQIDVFEKNSHSQMCSDSINALPMSDFSKSYLKYSPDFRFQQYDGLDSRVARYSK